MLIPLAILGCCRVDEEGGNVTKKNNCCIATKRAKYLSSKKPEYNFIGINLNTDEISWKQMIQSAGLDSEKQYKAIDSDKLRQVLIINASIKCIIADEDAVIVDAFSTMFNASL